MNRTQTLLAISISIFLLAGCSTTAMQSTPIWAWEPDQSDPAATVSEDRVNVWPLFYRQDAAWSALWPLISATPDGQAALPFYQYLYDQKDLRLGTIHQHLPALAHTNQAEETWRVLIVRNDRQSKDFAVIPLYFQDYAQEDGSILLIPVFYTDDEGFWTLPLTVRDGLTGVLGPLFYRQEHYRYERESSERTLDGFEYAYPWPLFRHRTSVDSDAFYGHWVPLLRIDKEDEDLDVNYLAYLGGWGRDGDRESHNYLFPLWLHWQEPDEDVFFSLPWMSVTTPEEQWKLMLLNLYFEYRLDDEHYQAVLWPLIHRFTDASRKGHAVLPLYYYQSDSRTGVDSLYTPLVSYRDDGSLFNLAGGLYHQHSSPDGFYRAVAWPLFHQWRGEDTRGSLLFPVYYRSAGPGDDRTLLTPLGGWMDNQDLSLIDVLGPLYVRYHDKQENGSGWALLWPFIGGYQNDAASEWQAFPLANYRRHKTEEGRIELELLLALLYQYAQTSDYSSHGALLNLLERYRSTTSSRWRVSPFFRLDYVLDSAMLQADVEDQFKSIANHIDPYSSTLGDPTRYPLIRSTYNLEWLLNFGQHRRTKVFEASRIEQGQSAEAGQSTFEDRAGTRYLVSQTDRLDGYFFPFYAYQARPDGRREFNLLWRLYDYERRPLEEGDGYLRRHRVLWRLFHKTTTPEQTSLDMFPFIQADARADWFNWAFAGGLLGWRNDAGDRTLRLLWLPIDL